MIKKIIPIIKDKKFFILGLLLTVSLLWPLVVAPYFTHHDDVQTIRLFEMDKCFQDGQIPCRWVPDLGDLYGYPLFNYYAPLPYYVGEIFYLITHNLIFSAKTMFAISFIGSYIFMFLLGKKLWGSAGGMVSGVFYSFAPYHAVDFYVRGAMGELWALMFFPAIFWATLRLKDSPKIANILLLSVSIAGLILSHNLSAMIFLPTVVLFSFVLFFFKKDLRFLATFVIAVVGGLLLPAFYLLPVIFEKNLVHVDTTTMGYFSYTEHFKGLRKLILDRFWGWGDSVREVPGGPKDGMSFQIGWAHLLALGFAVFAAFSFWKRQKLKSLTILFAVLVILGSIFMIHPRSEFIWKMIDPLKYLQFPWRFLMVIIFFISMVVGSIFQLLNGRKYQALIIGLVLLVVASNFFYFRPEKFRYINDQDLLTGKNWENELGRSIYDFLPIYAKAPPVAPATSRYEIVSGDAEVTDFQEKDTQIHFKVFVNDLARVELSQYYFPLWKVFVDGKNVDINYQNNLGLITFTIDPGMHKVEAVLYDTPIRQIGNLVTLISSILFIFLGVWQLKRVRLFILAVINGFAK